MLVRSKDMLLQFELCGQDVNAASYTFKLQQAMNFSTLKLKDVRIVCGNDKLQWKPRVQIGFPAAGHCRPPPQISLIMIDRHAHARIPAA